MNPIMANVLGGVLVAIISVSLTFFFTTVADNKKMKAEVSGGIKTHKEIDHQKNITKELTLHESNCKVRQEYFIIKLALIFLVKEAGGDPNELNLLDT